MHLLKRKEGCWRWKLTEFKKKPCCCLKSQNEWFYAQKTDKKGFYYNGIKSTSSNTPQHIMKDGDMKQWMLWQQHWQEYKNSFHTCFTASAASQHVPPLQLCSYVSSDLPLATLGRHRRSRVLIAWKPGVASPAPVLIRRRPHPFGFKCRPPRVFPGTTGDFEVTGSVGGGGGGGVVWCLGLWVQL